MGEQKLILEIEVDDFNTDGLEAVLEDMEESDSAALIDYLQDDIMKREVALGLGAFLSNEWQVVGRSGFIVGARLEDVTP